MPQNEPRRPRAPSSPKMWFIRPLSSCLASILRQSEGDGGLNAFPSCISPS